MNWRTILVICLAGVALLIPCLWFAGIVFFAAIWEQGPSEIDDVTLRSWIRLVNDGTLRGEKLKERLDLALAMQAERNWNHPKFPTWKRTWGEFIESVHDAGLMTDAQRGQYARESVSFGMSVRDPVRREDPIPVRLHLRTRLGAKSQFRLQFAYSLRLIGETEPLAPDGHASLIVNTESDGDGNWMYLPVQPEVLARLKNGPNSLMCDVHYSVFDTIADTLLAKAESTSHFSFQLWPENQAMKKRAYGEAERDLIRAAVSVVGIKRRKPDSNERMLELDTRGLQKELACAIVIRHGDSEWRVIDRYELKGTNRISLPFRPLFLEQSSVDVIIRPSYIDEWYAYDVYPRDTSRFEVAYPAVSIPQ